MQNWYEYENSDWNPHHHRSTMPMRIQDRIWYLLVISFFEVIYEGKNSVCLWDQSYLFAQETLQNISTTVRAVANWCLLKKSYRRQTFKGFQKDPRVWAAWAKGSSWTCAGVSASTASLSPTASVCCLMTERCLVIGSVGWKKLWKDLIDKKVWTWAWASHAVISHTALRCC